LVFRAAESGDAAAVGRIVRSYQEAGVARNDSFESTAGSGAPAPHANAAAPHDGKRTTRGVVTCCRTGATSATGADASTAAGGLAVRPV